MRWLLAVVAAAVASGHTFHSSIAQLDYLSSKKTIEAIVFLHTEDIERAFKEKHGKNADFDQQAAAERFVSTYLQEHFQIRSANGRVLPHKWVGLEIKVHFVAAYFEVPLGGLSGAVLTNKILVD